MIHVVGEDVTPQRIQRQRVKGWRMPEDAVYVGRPSKWGNPFRIGSTLRFPYADLRDNLGGPEVRDHAHAVALFRVHARISSGFDVWVRGSLADRDLCCWCPLDQPCHADVLLQVAAGGGS